MVAIDAVESYIEILRGKLQLQPDLDIQTHVADIRNLSISLNRDFDVVLFMGPIYHVPQPDIQRCIDICFRLLKPNGIFAASYVNIHVYVDIPILTEPSPTNEFMSRHLTKLIIYV